MNSKKNSGPGSSSPNSNKTAARVLRQKPASAKGDPGGNQVEVTLGGNQTLLLNAFNNSPLLMTISDLKTGRYLLVNDCFCRVSEIPRQEALGRTSVEIGWIEEQERARMVGELQRHGKISGLEITLHSRSGKSIICNYSGDILETTSGTWLFSTAEDITFRKRVEKQQEIFYQVLRAVSSLQDLGQVASSAVETIVRLTSYPHVCIALPDETGTHWVVRGAAGNLAAVMGTVHPIHQGVIGRTFKSGKVQRVDDVLKDPGYILELGKAKAHTLRSEFVAPIRHADNLLGALNIESERVEAFDEIDARLFQSLAEIIALALENARSFHEAQQEIVERKQTEQNLQETNALLSLFMKHSPIYSYIKQVTPTESRVLKASENYKDMTGIPGSKMTGMTMQELFPPEFAKQITADDWAVASDGNVLQLEESYNGRDYTTFKYPISLGNKNLLAGYTIDITERKRFEQSLREREATLRTWLEAIQETAFLIDRKGIVLAANATCARRLNCTQDQLVGACIYDFIPPQVAKARRKHLNKVIKSGQPANFVDERFGRFMDNLINPVLDQNGRVTHLAILATDITERKQADQKLQESEEKFRLLSDESPNMIFINIKGHIVYANAKTEEILGYTRDELYAPDFDYQKLIAPDSLEMIRGHFNIHQKGKELPPYEYSLITKKGQRIEAINASKLIQYDGKEAILGIVTDITERKQMEDTLQENEQRLESIYDTVGDVLYYMGVEADDNYRFISVNPAFLKVTGLSSAQVVGRKVSEVIPEPSLSLVLEKYHRAIAEKAIVRWVETSPYPSGQLVGEVSVAPVFDESGRCTHLVGSVHDLTEHVRAEEALRHSEQQLKKAQQVARVGSWIWHIPSNHLEWSDEMFHIFGLQKENFGGDLADVVGRAIHPEDRLKVEEANRSVIEKGQPYPLEYRVVWPDGSVHVVWAEAGEMIRDAADKPLSLAGIVQDITERKQVEQILRESESRFRTLIEQAPVAIIVSRDGIGLYANQKLRALYGSQDEQEGVGRPIMEYFTPQFQEQSRERTLRRIQGLPVPADFESVGMRQDGTMFPIHVAVAQVMLSDGGANIAFVTDISGRKQAEEGLKKSELTARQMAEQLKMVNQIGLKITAGLDFEQLLQTIYEQCQKVGPTDTFYVALYDESTGRLSFPFFYKDGKQCNVAARNLREKAGVAGRIIEQRRTLYIPDETHMPDGITPVRTPGIPTNSYIGVPLIVNDRIVGVMSMQSHAINAYSREQITTLEFLATQVAIAIQNSQLFERIQKELVERRQAEEKIREAQILLQASIESPKDMIILSINKNFQYLNFNSYHHEVMKTAYGKDVRIGMNLLDCITNPEDRRKSKENYERALHGINHTTIEEYGDLERSFYETRYNPIYNDKNEIIGATAFSANITARIRAEDEIRQLNTNLEQRVEERTRELSDAQEKLVRQEKLAVLGQLAGGVGHELRNPLSVINTAVYYLKLVQPDASEKVKQHLVMIEQEVATAGKIISDLLDFARIKSVDREIASIPELVQGALVRFPPASTIEIVLKLPPGLPKVFADPRQVEQVLGNLTVNACQAMQPGGSLTISARLSKGLVAIAVKDTGTGITLENMKKLFEPLFTTKTKGIGLGLAVSQKLAEANGGRIDVESEPGQGSTFTLWLPSHPTSEIEEDK